MELQVSGRIEREDYAEVMAYLNIRLLRASQKQNRKLGEILKFLGFIVLFAVLTVALLFLVASMVQGFCLAAWRPDIISIVLALATLFFVMHYQRRGIFRFMARELKDGGYVLQQHTFVITDEALLLETPKSYSRIDWPCIIAVETTKTMIYIFLEQTLAHYIPLRFFASESDKDAFVAVLQERIGRRLAFS